MAVCNNEMSTIGVADGWLKQWLCGRVADCVGCQCVAGWLQLNMWRLVACQKWLCGNENSIVFQ